MRILMVTGRLPEEGRPGTLAFVARQIESIRPLVDDIGVVQVTGPRILRYAVASRRLRSRAREYDLVHAHYGFCGLVSLLQGSAPVVVSFMGSDLLGTPRTDGRITLLTRVEARLNRWMAHRVAGVIVKSEEMASVIPDVNAAVIPNGVDLSLFRPAEKPGCRERLGWMDDQYYVLFPGDPHRSEKCFPLAKQSIQLADEMVAGAVNLVPLHGIPPGEVPLYLNASDCLLMTSLSEGSPNVVKESLACETPVVSVDVGDVWHTIADMKACRKTTRDPQLIAESLVSCVEQRDGEFGGRDRLAELGLSGETVAERICGFYRQVISKR